MAPPRRAIISVTSAHTTLHHGKETGLFISEALHPFNVFKKAGFEVDFVSETGTYAPDWLSEQPDFLPTDDRKQWEDVNGEFRKKLDNNMMKPEEVDASKASSDSDR
jgi:D-lactate dehydratase